MPVGALSVGQYRRLALTRLLVGHYDVLLFDEPTNHLAPVLVGELEEALAAWFAGRDGGTGPGAELRLVDGRVASFPVPV